MSKQFQDATNTKRNSYKLHIREVLIRIAEDISTFLLHSISRLFINCVNFYRLERKLFQSLIKKKQINLIKYPMIHFQQ
jgi:hypothetical protein